MPVDTSKEEMEERATASEKVKNFTEGNQIIKVITIPGKLVNIVVR